jgi:VCBS repeat-containing protein
MSLIPWLQSWKLRLALEASRQAGRRQRAVASPSTACEQLERRIVLSAPNPLELSSLDGTNGFVVDNPVWYSDATVSDAGDINGDGFDDVIIGTGNAYAYASGHYGGGYVVFGQPGGFPASLDVTTLNGSNGFAIAPVGTLWKLGQSVSSAGDVNGDGFDDLIVGAPWYSQPIGSGYQGSAYVIFGHAGPFAPSVSVWNLDGANGFRIDGVGSNSRAGYTVGSAGDVNGDGFDDVVLRNEANPNSCYVVFGHAGPFAPGLSVASLDGANGFTLLGTGSSFFNSLDNADVNGDGFSDIIVGGAESCVVFGRSGTFPSTLSLSSLDGTNGFVITDANALSSDSLSSAGDVNGDGFDDILVGDPGAAAHGGYTGAIHIIFGHGASFAASLDLTSLNGTNGFTVNGAAAGDQFGFSASSAGDVNGDGFDDVVIGASHGNWFNALQGAAYVLFGHAGTFTAISEISDFDGTNGFKMLGDLPGDGAGRTVSTAGDVNGDGFADLLICAPYADVNGQTNAGKSYIVFGGDFTGSVTQAGNGNANTLSGDGGANVINGEQKSDTLVGNGGADVLLGAQGNDTLAIGDAAFRRILGGRGFDTLRLDGAGLTLDLPQIPNNRLRGIESINLTGSGANTLVLNPLEVLNISPETNTLLVRGDANDQVAMGTGWTATGTEVIGGITFTVFAQGNAVLKVQAGVQLVLSAVPDTGATDENTVLSVAAPGVLGNDVPASPGDTLSVTAFDSLSAKGAAVVVQADGSYAYDPTGSTVLNTLKPGQSATDSFTYTVSDNHGSHAIGTVTITVSGRNDPPLANDDAYSLSEDGTLNVPAKGVLVNDQDPEGDALTAALVDNPQHGQVTLNPNGAFVYTPHVNFHGTDSFTYRANDGSANSNTATVHLTVTPETALTFASGLLTVASSFNDSVALSASGGNLVVSVNGAPNTSLGTVAASAVHAIVVTGGSSGNRIDLSGVAGDFTALTGVTVNGNGGDDTITGSSSNDSLVGGAGNDLIIDSFGNNTVIGAAGDDSVIGGSAGDSLDGGDGNDTLLGQGGRDSLAGGSGNDSLDGGDANDLLSGSAGADTLSGAAGDDSLSGDDGDDFLYGNAGNDTLAGGNGNDRLRGGADGDSLDGGAGNDTLRGQGGADTLLGGDGNDYLDGGSARDVLNGQQGNDTLLGGDERDRLLGGGGHDSLNGGNGDDTLRGHAGNDTLRGAAGADYVDGGTDTDSHDLDALDMVFACEQITA